jgi:hypothetical protein
MWCRFGVRDYWPFLFTDDPEVIDVVELILPVVFFSEVGDGLNAVCGGREARYAVLLHHLQAIRAHATAIICARRSCNLEDGTCGMGAAR